MDWQALTLSLRLAGLTALILLLLGLPLARALAWRRFPGKSLLEALITLPLVLPPTVLGYYLLVAFGRDTWLGQQFQAWTGSTLAFSFSGLLLASLLYSLPFAVQPMLRAFETIPLDLREAAWCSGLSRWQTFRRIELPLARNGILTALVLSFAHTLGEFGVVLMVGGNIPGATRTLSIAIYDRVQAFDDQAASLMSLVLLVVSFCTISLVYTLNRQP
ncbi:MAG: molybdate ABC transporter permease subunit, partial [Candidatus Competibacteraceae bacterium]|nr:molybdate ABC transporter permease subunit [Candidatus Competibacteraceae bacterium]